MKNVFMFLGIVTFAICLVTPGWAAKNDEIKIGVMAPITGNWTTEGRDMVNIVELLAKNLNELGGINGQKVKIIVADDAGNPRNAMLAAQKLISQNVVAVIGTYGSAVTEATQITYDEAKVIQIATGSTSVRLTEKNLKYFFRTCPRDDEQGRVLAAEVLKMPTVKKVAILHDNSSYATGLATEVETILKQENLDVVFYDALTPGERDYTIILSKLKAHNPDIIVFTGYYPEAGLLLRQKKSMRWDVPMIAGDAANNVALVKIADVSSVSGYMFVSPPGPSDLPNEEGQALIENYQKEYSKLPIPGSVWSIMAGDAFKVLVKSIEAVGTDSDKLADYMHEQKNWEDFIGFSGPISFNEKGDRIGDIYRLYQVNEEGLFILK